MSFKLKFIFNFYSCGGSNQIVLDNEKNYMIDNIDEKTFVIRVYSTFWETILEEYLIVMNNIDENYVSFITVYEELEIFKKIINTINEGKI